ncbi:response regulator [Bacteroidota bacterium]
MIDILVVDDHQMFIDGLKAILEVMPEINEVYEALNGKDAIEICKTNKIDFVLMDISMPEMDGIEASEKILEIKPDTKILMLTMYNDIKYIDKIINTNVSGYILKNTGSDELFKAINKVHKGERYFSDEVTDSMYNSLRNEQPDKKKPEEIKLTKREIEILKWISKEYSAPEIAKELNISQYTVETHRRNLAKKLNIKNSIGLAIYAIEKGFV